MAKGIGTGYNAVPTSDGNPWISALKGLGVGAVQSLVNYSNDPYSGGGAIKALGGAMNAFSATKRANKQLAEQARLEAATSTNAYNQLDQRKNLPAGTSERAAAAANNGVAPRLLGYEPTVGDGSANAMGQSGIAQGMRIPNANTVGLSPAPVFTDLMNKVAGAYQDNANLPVTVGGITNGQAGANNQMAPYNPMNGLMQSFENAPPGQPAAQAQQAPPQPAFPPFQQILDPQAPPANLQTGGISMQAPAAPGMDPNLRGPGIVAHHEPDLFDILHQPSAEQYRKSYETGGQIQNTSNTNTVNRQNNVNTVDAARYKTDKDYQAAHEKNQVYAKQVEKMNNLVNLFTTGNPNQKKVAQEAILKTNGGGAGAAAALLNANNKSLDGLSREALLGATPDQLRASAKAKIAAGASADAVNAKLEGLLTPEARAAYAPVRPPAPHSVTPTPVRTRTSGLTTKKKSASFWDGSQ